MLTGKPNVVLCCWLLAYLTSTELGIALLAFSG